MDDYIRGKLSDADKEVFEQHYFECDRCFEELQFRENLLGVIREHGEAIFADQIRKREPIRESWGARALDRLFPKVPIWRRGWVYAAVSIAVILILIPIFSTMFAPNKYEHLSDVKPYPYLLSGLRSGAVEGERLFHEGMRFYSEENYDQAAQDLKKAVALDPENIIAQFYLGVCFLIMDKPGEAVKSLERATVAQPDSEIFHWYLGQAYLKRGDGEKALTEFERVRDVDGDYRMRAEALIRKIEEIE